MIKYFLFSIFYFFVPILGGVIEFMQLRFLREELYRIKEIKRLPSPQNFKPGKYKVITKVDNMNANILLLNNSKNKIEVLNPDIKIKVLQSHISRQNSFKVKRINNVIQGTKAFIIANFELEDGVYKIIDKNALLVLFGDDKRLFSDMLESFNSKNYFWNSFTAPSLITGSFVFAYFAIKYSDIYKSEMLNMIIFSIFPFIPLFPPGVFFYIFYRLVCKISASKFKMARVEYFKSKIKNAISLNYKKLIKQGVALLLLSYTLIAIGIIINCFIIYIILIYFIG